MADHRDDGAPVKLSDVALSALLVLQVLLLFAAAPLAVLHYQAPWIAVALVGAAVVVLIIGVSDSLGARLMALLAIVLGGVGVVFRLHHPLSVPGTWFGHGAVIIALAALSLVVGRAVFGPGRVTHHRIQGAVVLYLNLAVAFTSAYRLIQDLDPGAFTNQPGADEILSLSSMLYFSFTTLTSTGYGDMLPVNPFARSLSNLEALMGQLYPAILLARIVTLQIAHRR